MSLIGQYLYPLRVVPPTRANLLRIAATARSTFQAGDTATLPVGVSFEVSDACNIACAVCAREIARDKRGKVFMSLGDFQHLFDAIRPVHLQLSGYGEPLLNKHVVEMITYATRRGANVTLVTNGTLLDSSRSVALADAGLARLKVSVDAADADVFAAVRQGADLEKVLGNVDKLLLMRDATRRPNPVVELQFTVFRDNVDQVEKLVELCRTRFTSVEPFFHVMYTYGDQAGFVEKTLVRDDEAVDVFRRAAATARRYGWIRTASSLDAAIRQLTTDLSGAPCYAPWYGCIVDTDGEVYPCCHHTIRGVSVGNALEHPFEEVWNGDAMRAFRVKLRTRRCDDGVCATCRYDDGAMDRVFGLARRRGG